MRAICSGRAWILVVGLTLGSSALSAQTPPGNPNGRPAPPVPRPNGDPGAANASDHEAAPDLPVSLERIRAALERAPRPVITLPAKPSFSIIVEGQLPKFEHFVQPGELKAWATPEAMTHQEFLDMVTPKEARPFASSVNGELAQVVATGVVGGLALSAVTQAIKKGLRTQLEREARQEVADVVEALRRRDMAKAANTDPPSPSPPPQ